MDKYISNLRDFFHQIYNRYIDLIDTFVNVKEQSIELPVVKSKNIIDVESLELIAIGNEDDLV